jgi:adenylyltransferase/sulfurtransferase
MTPDGLARYHRQMLLPGIGPEGQRRLAASHALLVGCGALGTVIADLLVRAGVGTLTIVDRDIVELTNLQRQTLFDEADARAGSPKAQAAAARLAAINSAVNIRPIVADFGPRNAERIASPAADPAGATAAATPAPGVIVDGTDNFQTRYLINDLCVKHGIPFVYGGAVGTTGMSLTVLPGVTPCLRCLFDQPPPPGTTPTCDTAGVLGPLTALVGAWQASEAIKILAGRADSASRALLEVDLWSGRIRQLDVSRSRRAGGAVGQAVHLDAAGEPFSGRGEEGAVGGGCECCVGRRFPYLSGDVAVDTTVLCGRNAVQVMPPLDLVTGRLDLPAMAARLGAGGHGSFEATPAMLRGRLREPSLASAGTSDGGEGLELTVFPDGRAIVRGTLDPAVARSIYARYVGS